MRRILSVVLAAIAALGIAAFASAAGKPPTTPNNPVINFVSPSPAEAAVLTSGAVSFAFTFNRTPKQVATVTCALSGQATASGPCNTPVSFPSNSTTDSKSGTSYTGLANGSYTFTATLTLTGGGVYTASRGFTVNVPAPVPHLFGTTHAGNIARVDLDGQNLNMSFINAGGSTELKGIAVDSQYVYWANSGAGTIGRADLDGQNVNTSFITGVPSVSWVAVDSNHIYWAGGGRIGRADVNGANPNLNFITGTDDTGALAVDSAHLYWTNSSPGAIGRADIDGQNVNQSFIAGLGSFPQGLAVDSSHIYWTNSQNGEAIGRSDLNGQNIDQNFVSDTPSQYKNQLALDSTHIYWNNQFATTISRADLTGQNINPSFATGTTYFNGLAVG